MEETVFLNENGGPDRFSKLGALFKTPLHIMIPKLVTSFIRNQIGYLITEKVCQDEIDVGACGSHLTNAEVIVLFEQLCILLNIFQLTNITHGAMHESSIFFSPSNKTFVLRGFSSFTDGVMSHYTDARATAGLMTRLSLEHGLALRDAAAAVHEGDFCRAMGILNDLKMEHLQFSNHCVKLKQLHLAHALTQEARRLNIRVDSDANAMMMTINMILGPVTQRGELVMPMFSFKNSPGTGMGPLVQILNAYFDHAIDCGMLIYLEDERGRTVWPNLNKENMQCTTAYFRVLGYLILYSMCMNIPLDVQISPLLIRLLFTPYSELDNLANVLKMEKEIVAPRCILLAHLSVGARPLVNFLLGMNWTPELLCDPAVFDTFTQTKVTRLWQIRHSFVFDRETVSERQEMVFKGWLAWAGEIESMLFLKWVTGSTVLNTKKTVIRISVGPNIKANVCFTSLELPEYALLTLDRCKRFFNIELQKEINVFNST